MRANRAGPAIAFTLSAVCVGLLLGTPTIDAVAQERGHHEFREHDVGRFSRHDLGLWRGGGWRHQVFNGRLGWWWVSGGVWYFYEAPIYPYPMVVSGMAFAEPVMVVPGAPIVIQQAAPPPPPPPPPQPQQQQVWYYCDNPAGYYPYVPTCSLPFRPVAAKPQ